MNAVLNAADPGPSVPHQKAKEPFWEGAGGAWAGCVFATAMLLW